MYIPQTSEQLESMLTEQAGNIELEAKHYDLELENPVYAHVRGFGSNASIIHLHKTLTPQVGSRFTALRFVAHAAIGVELSQASYVVFDSVVFAAPIEQSHLNKRNWAEMQHAGVGLAISNAGDGNNCYMIEFAHGCRLNFFETGILVKASNNERKVNKMVLNNLTVDSCAVGIQQCGCNDWAFRDGIIQMCRVGLSIDGKRNHVDHVHFERNELDLSISAESWWTQLNCDAPYFKVDDQSATTQNHNYPYRPIHARA